MAGQQGADEPRKPMRLINVRADEDLHALVDRAAEVSDSPDRSHWVREALTAGALKELAAHAAAKNRRRPTATPRQVHVLGMVTLQTGECTHPPTARWIGIAAETCTLCGAETRRRL